MSDPYKANKTPSNKNFDTDDIFSLNLDLLPTEMDLDFPSPLSNIKTVDTSDTTNITKIYQNLSQEEQSSLIDVIPREFDDLHLGDTSSITSEKYISELFLQINEIQSETQKIQSELSELNEKEFKIKKALELTKADVNLKDLEISQLEVELTSISHKLMVNQTSTPKTTLSIHDITNGDPYIYYDEENVKKVLSDDLSHEDIKQVYQILNLQNDRIENIKVKNKQITSTLKKITQEDEEHRNYMLNLLSNTKDVSKLHALQKELVEEEQIRDVHPDEKAFIKTITGYRLEHVNIISEIVDKILEQHSSSLKDEINNIEIDIELLNIKMEKLKKENSHILQPKTRGSLYKRRKMN